MDRGVINKVTTIEVMNVLPPMIVLQQVFLKNLMNSGRLETHHIKRGSAH